MNVLFIASGNHGALSPVVKNQADALASKGVNVDFFLIQGKGLCGYLRNVKPLRQYLRTHYYHAIHAHYSLSAFVASLAGAKPLIVSLMGSDVKAAGWYKFVIRLFAKFGGWKAIIVKSDDMYRALGIQRAVVLPNGVNMERFRLMDKAQCQKHLGWNIEKKHVLFPADALRPEKDFALAQAAVTVLDNTELHAFEHTPNDETPYWYNAADVVLMTSKWEGSPNAIKEAMACSRPIVTTHVGDVAERLKGLDGCVVVASRGAQEIAQALKRVMLFTDTKGRERIIADGLDVQVINSRLIEIYAAGNA